MRGRGGRPAVAVFDRVCVVRALFGVMHADGDGLAPGTAALDFAGMDGIVERAGDDLEEIKHMALIPNFSMLPVSRDDTDEILALKKKLDTTVYDGDTLGVLASSFTLNEDILINAEPSLGVKSIRDNYIVSLPQVDSRDRDLTPLYTVNYVLVASPAQTHLAEGSQTVVEEAVNSFMNYADIATAYEEVPECETVIDGITIKLFHRVRDEHQADIKTFEARLYK